MAPPVRAARCFCMSMVFCHTSMLRSQMQHWRCALRCTCGNMQDQSTLKVRIVDSDLVITLSAYLPKHASSMQGSDFHIKEYQSWRSTWPQFPSWLKTNVLFVMTFKNICEITVSAANIVRNDYCSMNSVKRQIVQWHCSNPACSTCAVTWHFLSPMRETHIIKWYFCNPTCQTHVVQMSLLKSNM